jgi:hypothetical protein
MSRISEQSMINCLGITSVKSDSTKTIRINRVRVVDPFVGFI